MDLKLFGKHFILVFVDDTRLYGYVRVDCGDEMSKRAKFILVTWVGQDVGSLKKAKVSTDKAFVKQVCDVSTYSSVNF